MAHHIVRSASPAGTVDAAPPQRPRSPRPPPVPSLAALTALLLVTLLVIRVGLLTLLALLALFARRAPLGKLVGTVLNHGVLLAWRDATTGHPLDNRSPRPYWDATENTTSGSVAPIRAGRDGGGRSSPTEWSL